MSEQQQTAVPQAAQQTSGKEEKHITEEKAYDSSRYKLAMTSPNSLSPRDILQLQRIMGNQAVMQLLQHDVTVLQMYPSEMADRQTMLHSVTSQVIQRVNIPSTHDQEGANRYVRERAYADSPQKSAGEGRRVGICTACGKKEFMERLQVDHCVPQVFLIALLKIWGLNQQLGTDIASELQLDWSQVTELKAGNIHTTSWREHFAAYEESDPKGFSGYQYEVLTDTDNLWLLCPECNGRREKTDKLILADYDSLNDFYNALDDDMQEDEKKLMYQYLAKWLGTNYKWDPHPQQQLDIPNSPGETPPDETNM